MAEAVGKARSGKVLAHSRGEGSGRSGAHVPPQVVGEWGAETAEVGSVEARTSRQVENPKGFQAWMKFRNLETDKVGFGGAMGAGDPRKPLEAMVVNEEVECRWAEGITWAIIEEEMAIMPLVDTDGAAEDEVIREIDLDVENVAIKLGRFRRTAVVLQALESSPSRDRVVAWIRETMVVRKGVRVSQVKALARREFLIVFNSEEDKINALTRPPCFIDGRVVRMIEWGDRFRDKLLPNLKAAWVELRDVPPFLEDEATKMLKALGPIVYQTIEKQVEMRYANIRGCVLLDMGCDLPTTIGIRTPWQKMYSQKVIYTRLPDRCYSCLQQGHWAKNCPSKRSTDVRRVPVDTRPPIEVPKPDAEIAVQEKENEFVVQQSGLRVDLVGPDPILCHTDGKKDAAGEDSEVSSIRKEVCAKEDG
ncbi:hypothetical protein R1sor_016015 [Riccia sorocarpa]|uniref:CCHC-type domain-containing protein n=1 Tax=Riccia sorocarpa TaxID=122646 RepID=A0ABD3HFS4_9MARC